MSLVGFSNINGQFTVSAGVVIDRERFDRVHFSLLGRLVRQLDDKCMLIKKKKGMTLCTALVSDHFQVLLRLNRSMCQM